MSHITLVAAILMGCALGSCPASSLAATTNATFTVSADSDDADETSGGTMYVTDGSSFFSSHVGFRFQNVTIPAGATVTSATLEVFSNSNGTTSFSADLTAEDHDDPPTFTTSNGNISSRTLTTAQTLWSTGSVTYSVGDSIVSPNFASSIQEVIDRGGWSSGNALVVITTPNSGDKGIFKRSGSLSHAPRLHVTYSTGGTYYVRPDGNDSNLGTGPSTSQAWQTLSKALVSSPVGAGDTIYVMSGSYTEEIAPNEDGTSSERIQVIADRDGAEFGGAGGAVTIQAPSGASVLDLEFDDYLTFTGFRFQGNGTDTIFLSDCDGIVFESCEVFDGDDGFNIAGSSTVQMNNCIVRDNSIDGIGLHGGTTSIYNCTIVNNADDGVDAGNDSATVVNCIVAGNGDFGFSRQSDGDGTFSNFYNLLHNNTSGNYAGASAGFGDITGDPLFVGSGNYRLQSSSPAIDSAGGLSGTVDFDHDGVARPQGSAYDMGAFEYVAGATTYYVRTDGSDSNSGTGADAANAWATIDHAADNMSAGDIVYVRTGVYAESVTPSVSGVSTTPIQFIADTGGAIFGTVGDVDIVPPSSTSGIYVNAEDYLQFIGFRIDGNTSPTVRFQDATGIVLSKCEVFDGGIGVRAHGSTTLTATNCVVHSTTNAGIRAEDTATISVWHCTVADSADEGIQGSGSSNVSITNCIVANCATDGLSDLTSGTFTHTFNLIYGNGADYSGTSASTGEISADPLFGSSYRLQEDSPAIDAGTNASGTVDDDFSGNARPKASGWDMGAYEAAHLIGHWPFDETSGVVAADSSEYGNDGTLLNGPTWDEGAVCGGLSLDGSTQYVSVPYSSELSLAGQMSFAAWVITEDVAGGRKTILSQDVPGNGASNYWFGIENDELVLGFWASGVFRTIATPSVNLQTSTWYHVAATFDDDTDTVRLYVDGVEVHSATLTYSPTLETADLWIGRSVDGEYWDGNLDDVRIYNQVLDGDAVLALYQMREGLLGHWNFDEGTGTTIADSSPRVNDASFNTGTPSWIDGPRGGALEFNGANDAATGGNFDPPARGAVALWFRSDGPPAARQRLWGVGGNFEMWQDPDGLVSCDVGTDGFQGGFITTTPLHQAGTWYHLVAQFDSATDTYEIYINGQLHKSGVSTWDITDEPANLLSFGTRTGSTERFTGGLDDFRVLCRWLSAAEVAELYGLVGHWKLAETSGTTATDSSGVANDAGYWNGATPAAAGPFPGPGALSAQLDDSDDAISCPSNTAYDITQEITLAAWVRFDLAVEDQTQQALILARTDWGSQTGYTLLTDQPFTN